MPKLKTAYCGLVLELVTVGKLPVGKAVAMPAVTLATTGPADDDVPSEYRNKILLSKMPAEAINLPGDTALANCDTIACLVIPFCTTGTNSEPDRLEATGNWVID